MKTHQIVFSSVDETMSNRRMIYTELIKKSFKKFIFCIKPIKKTNNANHSTNIQKTNSPKERILLKLYIYIYIYICNIWRPLDVFLVFHSKKYCKLILTKCYICIWHCHCFGFVCQLLLNLVIVVGVCQFELIGIERSY